MHEIEVGMQLLIFTKESVDSYILFDEHVERYWLYRTKKHTKEAFMEVVLQHKTWYLHSNKNYYFAHQQELLDISKPSSIQVLGDESPIRVMTLPYRYIDHIVVAYQVEGDEWYIGRSKHCDICYCDPCVSSMHAHVYKDKNGWCIEDLHSSNGVYVNGRSINKQHVKQHDRIQIIALVILVEEDYFLINQLALVQIQHAIHVYEMEEKRIQEERFVIQELRYTIPQLYEPKVIDIDSPPPVVQQKRMPLLFVIGPALTMGLSSISMGIFSLLQMSQQHTSLLQSISTLIMAFSMGAGTLVWPLLSRRYEKREQYRLEMIREDTYRQYLRYMQQGMEREVEIYQTYRKQIHHSVQEKIQALMKHQCIRYAKEHPSYGSVQLGYGELPCPITIEHRSIGFTLEKDPLQNDFDKLCASSYKVKDIGIALSLFSLQVVHMAGDDVYMFAMSILFQMAITHTPQDVRFVCFISREDAFLYGLHWLPHMQEGACAFRYLVCDESSMKEVYDQLQQVEDHTPTIFYFFSHTLQSLWFQTFHPLQKQSWCYVVMEEEVHCTNEVKHAYIALQHEKGIYIENFQTIPFTYTIMDDRAFKQCTRLLANMEHYQSAITTPSTIHFLDLYSCGNVKQLGIERRWKESDASRSLRVPIGMMDHQELLYLDAHEQFDGAHGLFAGMTGSGKSECLLTYILSLALTFSPNDVAFLLIDYKGGGMAKVCANLPHVAGIITNLDQEMMKRALYALQNELKKRQRIFNDVAKSYDIGNMNIGIYQRLSKEYESLTPLPHLFIIADEFAELKMAQSEFMDELKRSARIGRSLGIHLLLATQKPAGVIDDQIWSNAHFHICMKVQSSQDSQDMLRKDDAAYLVNTGECYMQVGYDEVYKKGQIAWAGGVYQERQVYEKAHFNEISLMESTGRKALRRSIQHNDQLHQKTQMEAVMEEIRFIAKRQPYAITPLWNPPLKKKLYASMYNGALCIVDDMKQQRQYRISFDETWFHHTLLYGMISEDKQMFLQSLLYQLSRYIHFVAVYIFDFDTHEFSKFKSCAHIVDIVYEQEEEKVKQFFYMLEEVLHTRKTQPYTYPIVWILHNFEVFHERYEEYEHQLMMLLREGESYGIYCILSTTSMTSINYRFTQYIGNCIMFHMHDIHDYTQVCMGCDITQPNKNKGSGIFRLNDDIVQFQTLLIKDEDIQALPTHGNLEKSYRIQVLPDIVTHEVVTQVGQLYLGKNTRTMQDMYWKVCDAGIHFIFYAFQLHAPFYKCLCASVKQQEAMYLINGQRIVHKGKTIQVQELLRALYGNTSILCVWNMPYVHSDEELKTYLCEYDIHKHMHIFLCSMEEQSAYAIYPWFHRASQEAKRLWVGKGFDEYRYSLRFAQTQSETCHKHEGLLWEEDTCIKLQLWEEIKNG